MNYVERFMAKVEMEPMSGCWIWLGCVRYANRYLQPWMTFKKKQQPAARTAWQLFRGDIPEGEMVLHYCHNSYCVNPFHLHLGNNAMNMKEMSIAGRQNGGNGALGNEAAHEIRELRTNGWKIEELAKKYGVAIGTISRIINGHRYKHIAEPSGVIN